MFKSWSKPILKSNRSKRNLASSFDFRLALILAIYLILGLLLIKYYRYQINPDGISYISIAQKYLNGDFHNAVTAHWGPLFSWLLMPFLSLGIEPLLAAKILNLLIGVATIAALRTLSYKFEISDSVRTVILFSAVPIVLSFAFSDITPDLLLTCILLFYLAVMFSADYAGRINKALFGGVLGGAAYLSKSFAFPFFISHFLVMNVLCYFRGGTEQERKKVVQSFLTGTVAFAVVSGVWIGLLTDKYGGFTFGAGKSALSWETTPGVRGAAVLWQGFVKPPNETAVSAWEDPFYLETPSYNPLESWSNFAHQLKVVAGNIHIVANIFMDFSVLSIAIAIAYLLFWLRKFKRVAMPAEVLYPTITIALFAGGYSLVLVLARYLWVLCLMSMLMGGYVLGRLFQNNFFTKTRRAALLIILLLSFVVPASLTLKRLANIGSGIYALSRALQNGIAPDYNIASNGNWGDSLYIAYHLGCRYYGVNKQNISKAELGEQLKKYGIDYYLVWGTGAGDFGFLSDYREITGGRLRGLKIYGLKKHR
jgi:hypothetical protein